MEKRTKVMIGAGVAAALAVAGGGVAIAATDSWSPREESQAIIDDAAAELGVQPSALGDALENALENRVDEAVEAGRLTEEQGAALKERIRSGAIPLIFGGFGHRGFGRRHFGHFGKLDAAATYLGLTEAELRERLANGDTLAEVAKAEGKSVDGLVQALVKAARKTIDDAVADGRLTQARANELKADLEERITDLVNGELPARGPGFHRGFGRFHGGPPFFMGARA
jgi:polyhydroxyalkanoate synthesis regulator phasin